MDQQKCKVIITDEVWAHIVNLRPEHHTFLWKKFGIMPPGAIFSPAYKMGRWDGNIRFYTDTGKTYVRLLDQIIPYIDNWGYEIILEDRRRVIPVNFGTIDKSYFSHVTLPNGMAMEIRPYQVDAINIALNNGSGFIIAATGAGKCVSGDTELNFAVPDEIAEYIKAKRDDKC